MIQNWGTFAPEEFASHHIGVPTHPECGAFLEVLQDPRLQEGCVAFWGFYGADPAVSASPFDDHGGIPGDEPRRERRAAAAERGRRRIAWTRATSASRSRVGGPFATIATTVELPSGSVVRDRDWRGWLSDVLLTMVRG